MSVRTTPTLSRRQLLTGLSATAASLALSPGLHGAQQPAASAPPARRILDLHHHFASPRWITRMTESQRQGWEGWQQYTPARAIETMDEGGTQTAFISCTEPGVWFGDDFERGRQAAILLSRDMNE